MIKGKRVFIVLLVLFFIFISYKLIYCKQNDGYSTITNYFKFSLNGDYKNAYNLLTDNDKKIVKISDFETYLSLISQCEKVEDFKITKNRELNGVIIGGIKYKKGIEYKITITERVYYYNSVKSVAEVRTVVQENNQ